MKFKVGDRVMFTKDYKGTVTGVVTRGTYFDEDIGDMRVGVHYDGEPDPVRTSVDCLHLLTKLEEALK